MVKKVLFVSFLTLALCFSQPTGDQLTQSKVPQPGIEQNVPATELHPTTDNITKLESSTKDASKQMLPNSKEGTNSTTKPDIIKPTETAVVGKNETATTNTTATSSDKSTEKPEITTTLAPTTTAVVPSTNSSGTTLAPTTTVAPVTTEKTANFTTMKPLSTTVVPVTAASTARGFDGASFIGGIILTLGLLAFGFVGFKYYRNQTERNYHTL